MQCEYIAGIGHVALAVVGDSNKLSLLLKLYFLFNLTHRKELDNKTHEDQNFVTKLIFCK